MQAVLPSSHSRKSLETSPHPGEEITTSAPSTPRILVVDDEQLIADTLVQILNRNGFEANAAYDGRQAVEAARAIEPEIVLSDVLMPHLDGIEAAITIRSFLPETRIVLFSGQSATVELLADARQRGHDFELLPKPIHPTQLLKHLRQS
jgi:CheY-like chemotaxis protein